MFNFKQMTLRDTFKYSNIICVHGSVNILNCLHENAFYFIATKQWESNVTFFLIKKYDFISSFAE